MSDAERDATFPKRQEQQAMYIMLTESVYRCSMYVKATGPMISRRQDMKESLDRVSAMSGMSSRREGKSVLVANAVCLVVGEVRLFESSRLEWGRGEVMGSSGRSAVRR